MLLCGHIIDVCVNITPGEGRERGLERCSQQVLYNKTDICGIIRWALLHASNVLVLCRHALNSSYCVEAGRRAGLTLRWGLWISQREAAACGDPLKMTAGRELTPGCRGQAHSEPVLARRSGLAGFFDLPRICHFILGFSFLAQLAEPGKDIFFFFFFLNQLCLPWMKARSGPKEIPFHFRIKIPFTEKRNWYTDEPTHHTSHLQVNLITRAPQTPLCVFELHSAHWMENMWFGLQKAWKPSRYYRSWLFQVKQNSTETFSKSEEGSHHCLHLSLNQLPKERRENTNKLLYWNRLQGTHTHPGNWQGFEHKTSLSKAII